jgi:mRNA interferase RelE/StbE
MSFELVVVDLQKPRHVLSDSGMPYALLIKASALKQLEDTDSTPTRRRIVATIHSLAVDSRPITRKKLAGRDACYRLRVGDCRIVYTVNDREIIVEIIKIGQRREFYRG